MTLDDVVSERLRCSKEESQLKRAELAKVLIETEGVFSDGYVGATVGAHRVTASRVRHLLEDRGLLCRVAVRQCRDGEARDMSRLMTRGGRI
jgi:hypothetical protein